MTRPEPLPKDVIVAIRAKQKIEAIKRLREQRKLSLREAKELVEDYQRRHRAPVAKKAVISEGPSFGMGTFIILLLVLAGIVWLLLR